MADVIEKQRARELEREAQALSEAMEGMQKIDYMVAKGSMPRRRSSVYFSSRKAMATIFAAQRLQILN